MSKRRLKTILDLSCGNSGKTNTNLEKNIKHGNQTFKDFLSAAEFVFEDFETDLVNFGNVNVVKNDVNMLLQTENIFDPDNTQYCVENESNDDMIFYDDLQYNVECETNNIVDNRLELNLINNKLVVCNENLHNKLLDVETFKLNDLNFIVEDNEENNVLNCKKRHSVVPQPDKWKRETTKRLRMNGEEYIGYERNKSVVSHNVIRPPRNIKPTCMSQYCQNAKNRFCNTFDETQRLEIFLKF